MAAMTDEEFGEFVLAAWPGLYRTAYLMLGDHQLAEDLVQTSLAKTYASWRTVKEPAAATAYARVVLANTAASWFRRRGWRNEHPTEVLPEIGVDHDPSTRTAVVDALATLAPRQRAVVVLRYYDDLSVREVAHALGISEGTVKSQTSDALGRLRELLADEEVPAAPVEEVLAGGRAIKRRRRTTVAVVGAVVAIVVAAGALAVADRADDTPEPARSPDETAFQELGAWARGDEVHVGNHTVVVPGAEGLRYSSAGVVVETDDHSFVLVDPAGEVEPLDLDLVTDTEFPGPGARVATDATAPYVAYVRMTADTTGQLTVRDLTTGKETTVGAPFAAPDHFGTVYSLWDDQVYYVRGQSGRMVDWRTGKALPYPAGNAFTFLTTGLGHGVTFGTDSDQQNWLVSSRTDGTRLLTVPINDTFYGQASLSPDGRYLAAASEGDDGFDVYDVATGESVHLGGDRDVGDYGWTPDGHLLGKEYPSQRSEVEVCDPTTGTCRGTGTEVGGPLTVVGDAVSSNGF